MGVDNTRASDRRVAAFTVEAEQVTPVALTPFKKGSEGRRPIHPAHGFDPHEPAEDPNGPR